ncbi:hypothetical protein TMatcc_006918 [Talaromyces marneffei ATCC 18224]
MNQATLKSLGWSCSLKPWRSHRKLEKAHNQILFIRGQIRKGFVVTEEQEEIAYRRYAEALSRLEDLTGYRFPPPRNTMLKATDQNGVSCSLRFQQPFFCSKIKLD